MIADTTSFFTQQGRISDPGKYSYLLDELPGSLVDMIALVQNLTVHVFWAERYGLHLSPERESEVQLRTLERRLGRTLELDSRPLVETRPLDKKLVGNCRDHSLLLAALLRRKGIPARARCGFGTYFLPNHFEDHWVTEYWDQAQSRWVLVDAQLDALQCRVLKINFDPLDVPRSQFIVAGLAWQMCRSGKQNPDNFGIFQMRGMGFVRGNLVRDVASLNKMELLPWDCWGVILRQEQNDPSDLQLLDEAATLTAGDVPNFERVHSLYQSDPRLRVDSTILSYVNGKMIPVNLD